jgi:hypothetical protein
MSWAGCAQLCPHFSFFAVPARPCRGIDDDDSIAALAVRIRKKSSFCVSADAIGAPNDRYPQCAITRLLYGLGVHNRPYKEKRRWAV